MSSGPAVIVSSGSNGGMGSMSGSANWAGVRGGGASCVCSASLVAGSADWSASLVAGCVVSAGGGCTVDAGSSVDAAGGGWQVEAAGWGGGGCTVGAAGGGTVVAAG